MSNRSLLEFNHDYSPRNDDADCLRFGRALRDYMRAADIGELPPGVVRKGYRHHTDPEPIKALADALRECADDLEAEINGCNNNGNPHPAVAHQYERDMATVRNARAALKVAGCGE